ncbi:C4-dicarboxylate anaerobic carrier [Beutenbergia cavernae DSM 12333]|uniref:C4-dicarboxylate anaerobic carrier n=1 Tax=Beutenbergia cavernae (strain ATCC BAA-8 / DSM 12333 / CCUG 43141 / JCM 11478 / NBRC 16432 / NCIMB 13614 / HKI 0122) TaxID=471853 RepID=C5C5J2_BEUC1|nr:YfcC family protein [Beutenbergia cavernae]ACQ80183.1 C4-dicarboxylate anaerobic carrier [Beutenbergia cavernae DSM 12333]
MSSPEAPADVAPAEEPPAPRTKSFYSSYTVLAIVTVAIWVLAFIIPSGRYELDADGRPVQGTYEEVPSPLSFWERVQDLFLSPVNGLYGVQDSDGFVSPDATGELFGSVAVFLFVLAIGVFVSMMMASGALDAAIARLAHRLSSRGWLLIVGIMVVFSLLGTVEGFAEETLGFYGVVVPLVLALGYDRMTAVGAIIVGAGVGVLASTVNPFAIGVASSAAGVSIGDGIELRAVMWVVLTAVAVGFVLRYAKRVRTSPETSLSGFLPGDTTTTVEESPPPMTRRQVAVLWWVGFTFLFMIYAIIPWSSIIEGPDAAPYAWELGWYFGELAAWFIVAAVVCGLIGGLGEKKLSETISAGAGDFVSAGLVIVLARGVAAIMNNAQITDTVLHSMESIVTGTTAAVFGILVFVVNLPLAFLIPSTSGHATLAMPIMAPLADFAGTDRSIVITAWAAASGWMNLWVPTTAVIMGGLALAKVGYDKWLRFIWPLLAILAVLICVFVGVGAVTSA